MPRLAKRAEGSRNSTERFRAPLSVIRAPREMSRVSGLRKGEVLRCLRDSR